MQARTGAICTAAPDVDDEQWHLTVDGRILGLTLTRQGVSAQLHLIGVNQHVTPDENAPLWRILLSTFAHTKEGVLSKGGLFICAGDFHAAFNGGRWAILAGARPGQPTI